MDRTEFLVKTQLFAGSKPEEIESVIGCLDARDRRCAQGAYIHRMDMSSRRSGSCSTAACGLRASTYGATSASWS